MALVAYAAALMTLGAALLARYLSNVLPHDTDMLAAIRSNLHMAFIGSMLLGSMLMPNSKDHRDTPGPSPRVSGSIVIVATGTAAGLLVARDHPWLAVLLLVATAVVGAAVWRFATKYENAIGEARFTGSASAD
ncbi:hypothetical protein [Sphingomonas sp. Leaf23]|uniref:hypothetical protein n=1 Tax=Sphingomonas sp. Leaf23 TaxID=1735689 RepID=UPI0012E2C7C9|nr:hypothetical protein [Sphingomonas sp. Leaf23]